MAANRSLPNIAVVVLDTLRKDTFDEYFNWIPGERFEQTWSTSHWTAPAHGSLFTGQYPSEAGVFARSKSLDYDNPVLAERLGNAGYTTRAFSANAIITREYGFGRGFQEFEGPWPNIPFNRDIIDFNSIARQNDGMEQFYESVKAAVFGDAETIPSIKYGFRKKFAQPEPVDDGASEALELIETTKFGEGEFFFCNLMEVHAAYDPPQEYETVDLQDQAGNGLLQALRDDQLSADDIRTAYDDCARYLSDVYRRIFAALEEDFDYVITLSDHGELFGEHGYWRHMYGLFPELTHVPLVVSGTGESAVHEEVTSLLDVHQTVLDIAGIDAESRGQSLLEDVSSGEYLIEYHGIALEKIRQSIREQFGQDTVDRYDTLLRGVALPEDYYGYETLEEFEEVGSAFADDPRERFETLSDSIQTPQEQIEREETDQQIVERLRDLGYA